MKRIIILLVCFLIANFQSSFAASFGQSLCKTEGYHCKKVKKNQSWQSMFPDAREREIVMRVNRVNTQVWAGSTIAVPDNLETSDIMDFSPFELQIESPGEKVVIVDPNVLAWGAYDAEGTLVRWGPASAGANYCKDIQEECHTPPGMFRVFSLGSSDCYSTKFPLPYGGAPMPYCMYFFGGQAFHGEPNGLPGYNASHGCVRLYVNDAEWLRYDFIEGPNSNNDYRGTRVIVRAY